MPLTGKKIQDTYKDLLQVENTNEGIDTTVRYVSDGEGTASILGLSSSQVDIDTSGSNMFKLDGVEVTATATELNQLDESLLSGTLGALSILDEVTTAQLTSGFTLPISKGGTGAITASTARLGLGCGTAAALDYGAGVGDVPMWGVEQDTTSGYVSWNGSTARMESIADADVRGNLSIGTTDSPAFNSVVVNEVLITPRIDASELAATSGNNGKLYYIENVSGTTHTTNLSMVAETSEGGYAVVVVKVLGSWTVPA